MSNSAPVMSAATQNPLASVAGRGTVVGLRQLPSIPTPVVGQRLEGRVNRYRVLAGVHIEPVRGEVCDMVDGKGFRVYRAGDVFETDCDYDKWSTKFRNINQEGVAANAHLFDPTKESLEQFIVRMRQVYGNEPPLAQPQYHNAPAEQPPGEHDDTYEAMNEADLRKFATELGLNSKGCKTKKDLINLVKSAEAASR